MFFKFNKAKLYQLYKNKTPYLLLLPALIIILVVAIYTFYFLFKMSLVNWDFGTPWEASTGVGFKNYIWLLKNPHSPLWSSLKVTVIYTFGTLIAELFAGFGIALLLNNKVFGRSIYTAILIIPMVIMPSMVGLIWRLYFSYDGLINYFLETFTRIKLNWYSKELALFAVMIIDIWEWTPFFILIFIAGLQSLPAEPFEAANVDGASYWQIIRHVTLPMLAPLILTASILRLMDIIRIFDVIYVVFGGGPGTATTTLPVLVWRETMVARNVGRGSAVGVMLIILIVCLTFILARFFQKARYEVR